MDGPTITPPEPSAVERGWPLPASFASRSRELSGFQRFQPCAPLRAPCSRRHARETQADDTYGTATFGHEARQLRCRVITTTAQATGRLFRGRTAASAVEQRRAARVRYFARAARGRPPPCCRPLRGAVPLFEYYAATRAEASPSSAACSARQASAALAMSCAIRQSSDGLDSCRRTALRDSMGAIIGRRSREGARSAGR